MTTYSLTPRQRVVPPKCTTEISRVRLKRMTQAYLWFAVFTIIVFSTMIVNGDPVVVTTIYQQAPYALQELPVPPALYPHTTRFGCGTAITPDGSTIAVLGIDLQSLRQFAQVYARRAPDRPFRPSRATFFGDVVDPSFLPSPNSTYSLSTSCPICLSSNGQWLVMGGWMTSVANWTPRNHSLIIAQLNLAQTSYQFYSRLYQSSSWNSTQRNFASDMVCASDLSTIIVSEAPANPQTTNTSAVITLFKSTTSANVPVTWNAAVSTLYTTAPVPPLLRLGLSGNELYYAHTLNNFTIAVKSVSNSTFLQVVDVTNVTAGMPVIAVALNFTGQKLIFTTQGPTFPGERYVWAIDYSLQTNSWNLSSAIVLTDRQNTSFGSWGAGSQLSLAPSASSNVLAIGLPNFPIKPTLTLNDLQSGALSIWLACSIDATASVPSYTSWLPAYSYAKPYASGLPLADGLGSSFTSHNVLSSDGQVLVGAAPLGLLTGRVFLFTGLAPVCPAKPVPPPQSTATSPLQIAIWIFIGLIILVLIAILIIMLK